ncbi:MAG: hypothetical protein ABIZ80_05930, partial [Bryobacteraceae bacterium]
HIGVTRTYTVPTGLEKLGDFSRSVNAAGALIPVYDPSTTRTVNNQVLRDPFPANRIPSGRLDPVALNVLKYYPSPNRAPDTLAGANNFRGNAVNLAPRHNLIVKVDENLGQKDKLTGRYIYTREDETTSSLYPDAGADTTAFPVRHLSFYYGAWTRLVSPTMVNELRVTSEDRFFHSKPQGLGGDWVSKLGLRGVPDHAFPAFNATGLVGIGQPNERQQFPIRQYQYSDNFTWIRGRHALKFGGEGRRGSNVDVVNVISGSFGFTPQATGLPGAANSGNGLASLLVGFPTSFSARQTPVLDRYTWYLGAFVQDDWNVHKDLTLNLGLRWETDTPTVDKNNRLNFFDLNAINPVSGTPGVVRFAGRDGYSNQVYNPDWNNFGPRTGFAWKAFGSEKTVVRGGLGVFFSHPGGGTVNSASLGVERSLTLNSPDNGITAPFLLKDGVPGLSLAAPTLDDSFGAVRVGQNANTAVTFYEPNRRTGYAVQYNFGIQRELPGRMVLDVSYVGSVLHKQPNSNITINQIAPSRLVRGAVQRDRPFPQFSNVTILSPAFGDGSYNSGLLRVEKRLSSGLNFQASYTWAKQLNNYSAPSVGDEADTYSNYYDRRSDWGPDGNDIRHRLTWSSVYEVPIGKGRRFLSTSPLRWVLGDWAAGAIVIVQSGAPFTVTTQVNTTNAFSAGPLRADVLRDPSLSEPTLGRWFDT